MFKNIRKQISILVFFIVLLCVYIVSCRSLSHEKLLYQSSEKPNWTITIPNEDEKYIYFVGISDEHVTSEKQSKNQAIADARSEIVKYYGTKIKHKILTITVSNDLVDSSKISKEFESQFAENEANFVHSSQVYSEKWLRKSSLIRWKTYVLCTVPKSIINKYLNAFLIEIERIRKQKEKKCEECYQFQKNSNFFTIKGNSYTDLNNAKIHAMKLYNSKIKKETQNRFNITFTTEHERELNCPDINDMYYYILGINYSVLDKQAVNEILKRVKFLNYDQMVDLLNQNKRLFSNINQNSILLDQMQSVMQYIKVNRERLINALNYETERNYFNSLKLLCTTKTINAELFKNDIKQIFEDIMQNKKRILKLYYKDAHLQISSLLKDYVPNNTKDIKNLDIKNQIDQIISESYFFEKETEIDDNEFYDDFKENKEFYSDIIKFEKELREMGFIYVNSTLPFYISDHEVTVSEYSEFYNKTHKKDGKQCSQKLKLYKKSKFFDPYIDFSNTLSNWIIKDKKMTHKHNKAQHPMNCVSWNEAQEFINWLNSSEVLIETYHYRLCSASEWEYAARNEGKNSSSYICGKKSLLKDYACFDHIDDKTNEIKDGTCEIRSKKPNDLGLFDMSGNVSEWVADDNSKFKLGKSEKGGSYWSRSGNIKLQTTNGQNRKERTTSKGFRLCISK